MKQTKIEANKMKEFLPGGHLHSYENWLVRLHVPPFWHCDGEQGVYFDSQFLPVCPGGQIHLFVSRKIRRN